MRKVLAVTVAVFVCATAWASRGRPVSDLRFEGRVFPFSGFVGSDGKDFLFLSTSGSNPYVYAQAIIGGAAVGPTLGIGAGTAAGISWTGIDYLVSWSSPAGMWTARVSRRGALIGGSTKLVMQHSGWFASNGQSALVVGRIDNNALLAKPLDLSGQGSGPAVTINMSNVTFTDDLTVCPSGSGYAIVSTGYNGTRLQRLRADATPLSAAPILIEGPYGTSTVSYHSDHSVAATDGTDTLILFAGEKYGSDTELRSVIIGPDGSVKRAPRTVYTMPGMGTRSLQLVSVVWTGSEYVTALSISKDPTGNFRIEDAGLLRISRGGDAVGDVAYTTSGERRKVAIGLGWNGSQFLLPWYDATTTQDGFAAFCAVVPTATMIPSVPAGLGRSLNTQTGLTITARNGQYLAAWFETSGSVTTVRASRIDAAGNFLDGEGITLGTVPPPERYTVPSIAIDSDGTNWLVVWANSAVHGRRLSRAGSLLDAQPFFVTGGYDVAVRWNGANYVVVAGNGSLSSAAVSRDGVVTSSRTLMTSSYQSQPSGSTGLTYTSPSLVVVGGETMAVYLNVLTSCGGVQPSCASDSTIVGWRLDSSANPIGAAMTLAKSVWSTPTLATDGTHHLLAWSAYDPAVGTGSIFGTVLSAEAPQEGVPFRIASRATLRDVAFDGSDFLVAFQTATSPYSAGTLRVTPAGAVKETAMLPLDDGESASNPTIATSPGMPALIGYLDLHPAYDGRSRGALLFSSEFTPPPLAVPSPPSVTGALRIDQNTIDVRWQPAFAAIGTSVELQLEDGAYRTIGVAGGGASSARFSLAGLQGSAIRLRAWNAAGLSGPSVSAPIALARQRAARSR
jgi:hypothetical protein